MREDVKKFLFFGLEEDKESFFQKAQSLGVIHFIDPYSSGNRDIPKDVQNLTAALKILRGLPVREQKMNTNGLDPDPIVNEILRLHHSREKLNERLRILGLEISRIEVFGNFSFEDIAYIEKEGKCKIRFFCSRPNAFEYDPLPENVIFVASEHGLDYYVGIDDHPIEYEKLLEMKFEHSLDSLRNIEKEAKEQLIEVEHTLKETAIYDDFLHESLLGKLNFYHLNHVQTFVQQEMGGSLFAIEGWVPVNKVDKLPEVVERLSVFSEEVAIESSDVIPTFLENHGVSRLGEDLVNIYDIPSATDDDPSNWVLGGFALFFAFIIGDAGYGFVYLMLALFLRYKNPNLKGLSKRVLNLFTLLCVGCIIWGTLMTSFFGMQISLDNPLRKISLVNWLAEKKADYYLQHDQEAIQDWIEKYPELKNVKDPHTFVSYSPNPNEPPLILNRLTDNIMFELALFVGVVHLILSLMRYAKRNWQHIGWILFLIGAYLYFPYHLETPSFLNFVGGIDLVKGGEFGLKLMFGGIGLAWILAIIRQGWTGIFEIMVLIQVFADALSYLRLYALGLAGAIVASTINEIASGLPLVFAILLILISHFVNIILGTMSGVIHGLRLNFLEWYHYSFEGGGKKFQPLKLLKRE